MVYSYNKQTILTFIHNFECGKCTFVPVLTHMYLIIWLMNLFLHIGITVTTNDGPGYTVHIHYAISKSVH